jgi:hypothetical protein
LACINRGSLLKESHNFQPTYLGLNTGTEHAGPLMAVRIFSNHVAGVFLAIATMIGDMHKVNCTVDTIFQLEKSPYRS